MPGFCRSVKASILAGMDLPIRFPNYTDVIAEDAARFRALSADERLYDEQKRLEWKAILEFGARHGFSDYNADRDPIFAEQTEPDFVVDIKSQTNA